MYCSGVGEGDLLLLCLRHTSANPKIYGLLQQIIICTFTLLCYLH